MICAAPFLISSQRITRPNLNNQSAQQFQYYRARITHRIDNVTVEVFFIDWGNTEQVSVDQLRVLDLSLLKIAPLAFECQQWSIRPNVARCPLNNWPLSALNYVCSLILERHVEAEIKAHDYRIRRDAQRFVSHTNDFSSNTDPSNTSMQMIDIPKEFCRVNQRKEIGQPVTLTGPYSPLESSHSSCHYATKMLRVQIDGESINSIGLEEEQHFNYRRLLVAFGTV